MARACAGLSVWVAGGGLLGWAAVRPGGLAGRRELALREVPGVRGVGDLLADARDGPGLRLARGAHALGDLEDHDGAVLAVACQLGDLDALAWASRADQRPSGLDAHEVGRADPEARSQDRPALG